MMSKDDLKEKIRRGEQVVGVNGVAAFTRKEEFEAVLEKGPYEFGFIDSQHSPLNEDRVAASCVIATECGLPILFRIKHTRQTYRIGNYLDLGPSGIEVPQVDEVATAIEAVDNFYYQPCGRRSHGGGKRVGAAQFTEPLEYGDWWNNHGILMLQVESVQAVTSAAALARAGVDCLSFGPADLACDLKYNPHPTLKTVDQCVDHVVRALEGSNTVVSFRNGSAEQRQKYADMGVKVFLESPQD
jgi:2-keto-3-deoxy-L-rhamnonate aldolase RhmA